MSAQTMVTIDGVLTACSCGRQPKHYMTNVKEEHRLECPPCCSKTPWYSTFNEAVDDWESRSFRQYGAQSNEAVSKRA